MQTVKDLDHKAFKPNSLFYSFAIIVILLCLISIINVTVRSIFTSEEEPEKIRNEIFDPEYSINWTAVCPILKDTYSLAHTIKWRLSKCYNKTLLYWYIPWVKAWIWQRFNDVTEERKRLKELEMKKLADELNKSQENTIEPDDDAQIVEEVEIEADVNKSASSKMEAKREVTSVVYTALSALVLMSAVVACIEFFHDKFGKKSNEELTALEQRRCSLADFTMNKHLRKESHETLQRQAAFDEGRKKVKRFLHQGSLDRAINKLSSSVSSRLPRQSSVPLSMTSASASTSDQKPTLQSLRNASVDTSEDERSPNMRRRSRHFIRRH